MPAIQWINDARGEFGRGEMEDGVRRFLALADAVQQRQTGQIIDVFDAFRAWMGVRTMPGATVLTRILSLPNSAAS